MSAIVNAAVASNIVLVASVLAKKALVDVYGENSDDHHDYDDSCPERREQPEPRRGGKHRLIRTLDEVFPQRLGYKSFLTAQASVTPSCLVVKL